MKFGNAGLYVVNNFRIAHLGVKMGCNVKDQIGVGWAFYHAEVVDGKVLVNFRNDLGNLLAVGIQFGVANNNWVQVDYKDDVRLLGKLALDLVNQIVALQDGYGAVHFAMDAWGRSCAR